MKPRLEDFTGDRRIIDDLFDRKNRLIMVIGGSDSGKTTFVECLAGALAAVHPGVGVADLDMGQSHIGPPTSVAWGKAGRDFGDLAGMVAEDFYFTGTVTPVGSLLPSVAGAKVVTDSASLSCRKIVIDTTGLIAGPVGRVLKQFKIDILDPDVIIALEDERELAHILDAFRAHRRPVIHRIAIPVDVRPKSTEERSAYRFDRIMAYFKDARSMTVSLKDIGIRFTGDSAPINTASLRNRIVSLRDEGNRDRALGIVEEVITKENRITILTPATGEAGFSTLVIGKAEIDRNKKELRDRKVRKTVAG